MDKGSKTANDNINSKLLISTDRSFDCINGNSFDNFRQSLFARLLYARDKYAWIGLQVKHNNDNSERNEKDKSVFRLHRMCGKDVVHTKLHTIHATNESIDMNIN